MGKGRGWVSLFVSLFVTLNAFAQDVIEFPDISYAGTPRTLVLGGINVSGMDGYEDYALTGISGLTIGQEIEVPGTQITDAVKRYWRHGLFSNVSIAADSIVGNRIWLHITLAARPRVSEINYVGLKKSEREDMEKKLGMTQGMSVHPNVIDRAKILAKKYIDDKGFKNADIEIYSDSTYVVNAVTKGWLERWVLTGFKGKANADLWERYLKCAQGHNIRFIWVKGHAGHPENERCDSLAVAAYKSDNLAEDDA